MPQKYTVKCLDTSYTAPSSYEDTSAREAQINEALMLLQQLHPALQAILDAELKAGNRVLSVSTGYPDKDSISVCLARRFQSKYQTSAQVDYELEKDPHYGYAGYTTREVPRHNLLC